MTVRVSSRRPVRAKIVDEPLEGFEVDRVDLPTAIEDSGSTCRIAASRHGTPLTAPRLTDLVGRIQDEGLTLALGAPARGLPEILDVDADSVDDSPSALARAIESSDDADVEPATGGFDCWLNTIPNQGSETVRTEEALFASLATCTLTE